MPINIKHLKTPECLREAGALTIDTIGQSNGQPFCQAQFTNSPRAILVGRAQRGRSEGPRAGCPRQIFSPRPINCRLEFAPIVGYSDRVMFNRLIRYSSVVGFRPNNSAAPPSPDTLHLTRSRTLTILSRSKFRISVSVRNDTTS